MHNYGKVKVVCEVANFVTQMDVRERDMRRAGETWIVNEVDRRMCRNDFVFLNKLM